MPLIQTSSYRNAPFYQFNGHLQTIFPSVMRKVNGVQYERERYELDDGDFLDLDWIDNKSSRLVILTHGLESSTDRHYMRGMAKIFSQGKWDVLAWNCRSCSGEMNRNFRLYHHGEITDIDRVLKYALRVKSYNTVVLIGFSMGGSITMKYLGTLGKAVPSVVKCGLAFSSPCDLEAGVEALEQKGNSFYKQRFLKSLSAKVRYKAKQFPGKLDISKLAEIQRWRDFDEAFSAPISGYPNAAAFYKDASAKYYMPNISIPFLLVNAHNDPILNPACTPVELCEKHPLLQLEMPKMGGHVGFARWRQEFSWAELRAVEFVESLG